MDTLVIQELDLGVLSAMIEVVKRFVAKRVGTFIKKERNKQNMSIRACAKDSLISHTTLANIENGKTYPPDEMLNYIFDKLMIENDIFAQISSIEETIRKFNLFFELVYKQDRIKANSVFQEILEIEEKAERHLLELDFCLIKLIYYTSCNRNSERAKVLIDSIDQYIDDLFEEELVIYWLYKSQYLKNNNKLDEAESLLLKAKALTKDDRYLSLIYNFLGIVCTLRDKTAIAMTYYLEAKKIFDIKMNYIRSLYVNTNIVVAYVYSKAYEDAISACVENIEIAEQLSLHKVIGVNAQNLSYVYMMLKEYERVNEYVKLSIEHGVVDNGVYFNNAYSYLKLNKISSCQYWINEGRTKMLKSETMLSYLFDYLDYRIENNLQESINVLDHILQTKNYEPSFTNQDRKMVLKEIVELGTETGNTEILSKYGKEILEF
ncbi:helix-turn-helix domain-containing protein [Holdemania massiliensis]|nr:helix-turn-helix transcriptional regulator [Holdemania massiliensis]